MQLKRTVTPPVHSGATESPSDGTRGRSSGAGRVIEASRALVPLSICQHPQRPNIDLAIATGISRRLIAARFKVSADAAWRHGREHLTPEIRAALATKVLA